MGAISRYIDEYVQAVAGGTSPVKALKTLVRKVRKEADEIEDAIEARLVDSLDGVPGISRSRARKMADYLTDKIEEGMTALEETIRQSASSGIVVEEAFVRLLGEACPALWTVDVTIGVKSDGTTTFTNDSTTTSVMLISDEWNRKTTT